MSEHAIALRNRLLMGGTALVLSAGLAMSPLALSHAEATPASSKQAEAQAALSSLNAMKSKVAEAESSYGAAIVAQEDAQKKMDEAQSRIDEANERISVLQEKLGDRAKNMYMSGAVSFLDLLLGASTFQAFTTNWDMLNAMNQNDADMVTETKDLRGEVEQKQAEYAEQKSVAEEKASEMAGILAEAEALAQEQQAIYDNLSAEAAALVEQEEAAQAQAPSSAGGNGGGGNGGGSAGNREPAYVPSTGNAIVDRARSWVGRADYAMGACSPGLFDCSGFVAYCLSGTYVRQGGTSNFMTNWPRVSDPQPGDVVCNWGHCGIYIGGGRMIHSSTYGVGVIESSVEVAMNGNYVYLRP